MYCCPTFVNATPTIDRRVPFEALVWAVGIAGLAVFAPTLENRLTLCIPSMLGVDGCWGCGLGAAIGYLFRGEVAASFASHPLGLPVTLLVVGRIAQLLRPIFRNMFFFSEDTHG